MAASTAAVGALTDIHSSALNALGTTRVEDGAEYIYLKGVASTAIGSWVTYDEAGATALLAANAVGDVAVAQAAVVADKYGWYCVRALSVQALAAANSADNAAGVGREGADGSVGDGRAAGDAIIGAIQRSASVAAGLATFQIHYPKVNDATGA